MQTFQNVILCNIACLAIAALYYSWRDYRHRVHVRTEKLERMRERVSRLLLAAANNGYQ